ncbi:MAG: hypothetical protein P4L90_26730 [Rhodopila sp.]|nr:hypothetical protein [Rhodopila sp.]
MEDKHVASALAEKRARIAGIILGLEEQLRQARQDLAHIDASIRLFDPSLDVRKIKHRRPATRNILFEHGEISRRCREALRDAHEPLTAATIALCAMQDKKLDLSNAALRVKVNKSFLWALRQMYRDGSLERTGTGLRARWGLPLTVA